MKDEAICSCPAQGPPCRQETHGEGRERETEEGDEMKVERGEEEARIARAQKKSQRKFLLPVVWKPAHCVPQGPPLPCTGGTCSHRKV